MNPHEFDVPSAQRFRNSVREVNILSLFVRNEYSSRKCKLRGVDLIVPFLQNLPQLQRAFVGGKCVNGIKSGVYPFEKIRYYYYLCSDLSDQEKFERLLHSFCAAFQVRSLSSTLDLDILNDFVQHKSKGDECEICKTICKTFPIDIVMELVCPVSNERLETNICLSQRSFCNIIRKKTSYAEVSELAKQRLYDLIDGALTWSCFKYDETDSCDEEEKIVEQMSSPGKCFDIYTRVHWIKDADFDGIQALIDFGCDPKYMYSCSISLSFGKKGLLLKSTLDRLLEMGFPLNAGDLNLGDTKGDLNLVDTKDYPAIRDIIS
eukprot:CAMPEP_0194228978 /NCGR_PEP_ID=MMETSP0156-20130528/43654_1 /TAXON_ID=33649 /ORGANISM="Thalassionema nitzschioides, Strain L26-B" /LENGTH=319 /DNA_ID=CAMNT_0038961509 /DNA_START=149 /DNA_END=1104 /DNA_ORIENTATION=-